MRIITGRFGGRRLAGAPARGVRPTSDRVREALFAVLGDIEGARVLDLYAGTGALGIEALSRGAARAVFVERARAALEVLRRNLATLGLEEGSPGVRVVRGDAPAVVRDLARDGERFELILVDPPYASAEAGRALRALAASGVLAPGAQVVLEASRRHPLPAVPGLVLRDERRYGDTRVARFEVPDGAAQEGGL